MTKDQRLLPRIEPDHQDVGRAHILAFEGDSQVRWLDGNFSDYEADKRKRLGIDADMPHRIKYKPLTR